MEQFEKLLALALRFLSLRPRSEKEIKDYLQKKKYTQDVKDQVLSYLHEHRLIDDEEFARWFVDQRTRVKPEGERLIRLELRQKGIANEVVNKVFQSEEVQSTDQVAIAKTIIEKRLPRYKHLPKQELYKKLGDLLARRGFDWETIRTAIERTVEI